MTKEEILLKLKPIIADRLNISEDDITGEKTLSDLGADSLDAVDAIMEVEKEFDIAIPDTDMESLTTIQSIVDYIGSHTKQS